MMYTPIETAKLNGDDLQAWLADVLAPLADIPQDGWTFSPGPGISFSGLQRPDPFHFFTHRDRGVHRTHT